MHAILALGATHLSRIRDDRDYNNEALAHRVQAIAGLNCAIAQTTRESGESDAMLATCYALTFQSSYMADALIDFIAFIRGCALVTDRIRRDGVRTFFNLQPDWHLRCIEPRLQRVPQIDRYISQSGVDALQRMEPILPESGTERAFHLALREVLETLLISAREGYLKFVQVYAIWYELNNDNLKTFINSDNTLAQLLLAYFTALQMVMIPLTHVEWLDRSIEGRVEILFGIVEWARKIFDRMENDPLEEHLEWPKTIVAYVFAELEAERQGKRTEGPQVLQIDHILQYGPLHSQTLETF